MASQYGGWLRKGAAKPYDRVKPAFWPPRPERPRRRRRKIEKHTILVDFKANLKQIWRCVRGHVRGLSRTGQAAYLKIKENVYRTGNRKKMITPLRAQRVF